MSEQATNKIEYAQLFTNTGDAIALRMDGVSKITTSLLVDIINGDYPDDIKWIKEFVNDAAKDIEKQKEIEILKIKVRRDAEWLRKK